MAGPRVSLEGADTFDRTLDAAAEKLEDMDEAVAKTNALIVSEARALAPRRSGRLAASITSGEEKNAAIVGSDLVYALPIHWGWRARNIPASLFLTEAVEGTESTWIEYFQGDIKEALGKVRGA